MLYTYAATAIAAAAIGFAGAWQTQAWRYDVQLSKLHAQHATALSDANRKALDETIKLQRKKDDAIKQAEQRAKLEAANAVAVRTERDSLRAQLAANTVQLPVASCTSVRQYTATLGGLFDQCAEALTDMAGKAQGHAADSRLMLEAWPSQAR